MRKAVLWSLAGLLAVASGAGAADPELKTEDQETLLYALGVALSQSVTNFNLTAAEVETVKRGLTDGALHKDTSKGLDMQVYMPKIQAFAQRARGRGGGAREEELPSRFLDKAAAEKVPKLPSGVIYVETKAGTGSRSRSRPTR